MGYGERNGITRGRRQHRHRVLLNAQAITVTILFVEHTFDFMDYPWLKNSIQYDPYEEPDYPEPKEGPDNRPQFVFFFPL